MKDDYIFVCFFIYHDKSRILRLYSRRQRQFKCCNMSPIVSLSDNDEPCSPVLDTESIFKRFIVFFL